MSLGKSMLLMALIVLIGLPMVAYVWETINELLLLKVNPVRIAITVPVFAVLVIFLRIVAKRLPSWQE